MRTSHQGPLVGLRVIDIGHYVAGPLAATLLADYGADVIKVERPGSGDPARRLPPLDEDVSLWWKVNARNKRCIALDLHDAADRTTFLDLVAQADVVVENYLPGTIDRMGVGYSTLQRRNPGIILLSVSGFGQTGPHATTHAFGRIAEAFGGMASVTGHPDGPPIHSGLPIADAVTGVFGALAIMSAIYEREHNDDRVGQHIDLALYESIFRLWEYAPIAFDRLGTVPPRPGAGHPSVAPAGSWQTADGSWVSFLFGAGQEEMVRRMFEVMEVPELADDPRFATNADRIANQDELDTVIARWMATTPRPEVLRLFAESDLPIAPVMSVADAFTDPHYEARDVIVDVSDPELGLLRMQGVTPKFSRTPGAVVHPGRSLNADATDVLADWLGTAGTEEPT